VAGAGWPYYFRFLLLRNDGKLRLALVCQCAGATLRRRGRAWTAREANVEKDFVITRFINICWYLFKIVAALAVFVAIGLAVFLFTRLDDEIRRQAEQFLDRQFPQFNISVGGARLVEGQGIAIYDLTISETSSTQLQNHLLVVDEIMLYCDAQLSKLVNGVPEIRRVVVRHPQAWAAKHRDGTWNLDSLWPLPKCAQKKPEILIENAQLMLADQSQPGLPPLSLRDINLTIRPLAAEAGKEQPLEIEGAFSSPWVEQVTLQARCDLEAASVSIASKFEQLQIGPGVLAWVAAIGGQDLGPSTLRGKVDGQVAVAHRFGSGAPPGVDATLQLHSARLTDPRLPGPITDLSGLLQCKNDLLTATQIRGSCGSAQLQMQLQRRGWARRAPLALGLRLQNLVLEPTLYAALPPLLQHQWDKYQPSGLVDATVQATFDGQQWQPVATLTGRNLSFESDKFPYRLHDGSGTMTYTPRKASQTATLDIDLVGHGGGQPLHIVGQAFDPRPGALGWVEVTGANIEIEKRMIAALPTKARQVIQSIHPRGKFNLHWRIDRTQPDQLKPHTSLRLELIDCQVNYEKFPYPLSGVQGLVLAEDQNWTFRDLVSTGSRSIQCQGHLRPLTTQPTPQSELVLQFTGQRVPLDDDLRAALPLKVQEAWREIHPAGEVDLQAEVRHLSGDAKPTIAVTVLPLPESTTIRPKFFPYAMDKVEGRFTYQDGAIDITQLRAQHGRTSMRSNGQGAFRDDGSWFIQFEGLAVDRLMARRDLTDALPTKLQKLIEYLRPSGSFNLSNGVLRFSKANARAAVESDWDVQLNCMQANIQAGIELHNIHGAIRLEGAARSDRSFSAGELAIDSATFQDVQFTEIQGPLWVDQGQCLFGEWATKQRGQPVRRLTAQVYDGAVTADAWVSFDVVPEYSAVAAVTGVDLNRMMKERINGELDYQGKLGATLTLNGKGRSLATLAGHGQVQITEANIYELPILVSMLKVLRNTSPDSTAFNQVDSKFRIQGPHIYLDQLDFKGDAVSLLGRGETNFDHQLNLDFHAVVGRNEIQLPLVKNFVNRVGEQTLQLTVSGTLSDPQVDRQALPGINQLIKQLQVQPEARRAPADSTPPRQAERTSPLWPLWGR
jgi:hypothetical protein